MGADTWSTAFVIINVPARFFCFVFEGADIWRVQPQIWLETIILRGAERTDGWSISDSVFERALFHFAHCPRWDCGSSGFCGVTDGRWMAEDVMPGAAPGHLQGQVWWQQGQRPPPAHFWGTAGLWEQGPLALWTQWVNSCRVQGIPRYGYGKAHNIKINEHSCNFN